MVVDDGSPDGTAAAITLNARYQNIRVISRSGKEGLGSALRRGYDEARHEILVSCDADGSFLPQDIVRLAEAVGSGADLALGSRHSAGAIYETPNWKIQIKYAISRMGNWFLRTVTGLPLHDFSANCRAIRRDTWHAIRTSERSNALLLEMILKVSFVGGKIQELPVVFEDRKYGRSKLNMWKELPTFFG